MIMDDDVCGAIIGMLGRGNQSTWTKPDPGLNSRRRGGKLASNRLSYGTAMRSITMVLKVNVNKVRTINMQI
jgi:hypothetical protein